jgi:hypothetical protein
MEVEQGKYQKDDNEVINLINLLGMVSAVTVLVSLFGLRVYFPKLTDRVSLRFLIAIGIADVVIHLLNFMLPQAQEDNDWCKSLSSLIIFFDNLYCLASIGIAFNLQLIVLHHIEPNKWVEVYYWIALIGISAFSTAPFIATQSVGYDKDTESCLLKDADSPYSVALVWCLIGSLKVLSLIYCPIICIVIWLKIDRSPDQLDKINDDISKMTVEAKNRIRKLIKRSLLYPIAPLLTQLGPLVYFIAKHAGWLDNKLSLWKGLSIGISGLVTLISLFMDPAFQKAIGIIYTKIVEANGKQIAKRQQKSFINPMVFRQL